MNRRGEEFFKAYLNSDGNERLRKYLTPDVLERLDTPLEVAIPDHFSPHDPIDRIHWSWFLPILQDLPNVEKKIYVGCMLDRSKEALAENLKIETDTSIAEFAKPYIRSRLYQLLLGTKKNPLLPECLPPSPLNALLQYSKQELLKLINYLSLFDLAIEMRQIVETKILKKLYSFLTEAEKQATLSISILKEGSPFPKMGLDRWDGAEESLRHLLHRRGLQRLSLALAGSHPDLIWHIAHLFDSGRGGTLLKTALQENSGNWTEQSIAHIEEWLKKT